MLFLLIDFNWFPLELLMAVVNSGWICATARSFFTFPRSGHRCDQKGEVPVHTLEMDPLSTESELILSKR